MQRLSQPRVQGCREKLREKRTARYNKAHSRFFAVVCLVLLCDVRLFIVLGAGECQVDLKTIFKGAGKYKQNLNVVCLHCFRLHAFFVLVQFPIVCCLPFHARVSATCCCFLSHRGVDNRLLWLLLQPYSPDPDDIRGSLQFAKPRIFSRLEDLETLVGHAGIIEQVKERRKNGVAKKHHHHKDDESDDDSDGYAACSCCLVVTCFCTIILFAVMKSVSVC